MTGVPRKSISVLAGESEPAQTMSVRALSSISTTGIRMLTSAAPKLGRGRVVTSMPSSSAVTNSAGTGTGAHRAASLLNSGPAMITVGMATATPSARVRPRFAPRAWMATSGPGCGGTRPCIADRPARVGMAMRISGRPERRATRMITGISSTRPTSKNIGKPMSAPTKAMVHGSAFTLDLLISVSTIRSAPPESASSLPYMAPRPIRMPTPPMVSPKPLANAATDPAPPRPAASPTPMAPIIRARKACSFSQVINSTITAMPPIAAMISCALLPLGTIGSVAALRTAFIVSPMRSGRVSGE